MKSLLIASLIAFLSFGNLCAQQAEQNILSTAGGVLKSETSILEFSIGEIATETFISSNYQLTQGFLQPEIITVPIKVQNYNIISLNLYPNPANNNVFIEFQDNNSLLPVSMKIIDINGKVILNRDLNENLNEINISAFHPGIYLVKITNYNNEINETLIFQKN